MHAELALLAREFVRLMPDAYQDFRIPDPAPKPRTPGGPGLRARLLTQPVWRLLPTP